MGSAAQGDLADTALPEDVASSSRGGAFAAADAPSLALPHRAEPGADAVLHNGPSVAAALAEALGEEGTSGATPGPPKVGVSLTERLEATMPATAAAAPFAINGEGPAIVPAELGYRSHRYIPGHFVRAGCN